MNFHVGFTGTRVGMNGTQLNDLEEFLAMYEVQMSSHGKRIFAHSGDCIGADRQFNDIATDLGFITVGHPGDNETTRAHCTFDICHDPKRLVARDKDIVNVCDLLCAGTRLNNPEGAGSGTWLTVRYANEMKKPVEFFYPGEG